MSTEDIRWQQRFQNFLKDYFEYQGNTEITGSRDVTREAFNKGIISDGDGWMEMIKSRNKSSHTYNEDTANEISKNIIEWYYDLFLAFKEKMTR
jgi:nucleotidyltransferase substrate binding protein (TIGR01987 family)